MLADMAARTINGLDELTTLVGEHLGYSDYVEITQEQVNAFADATGDHQWIHVDVERAKAGPFGAPIAHGYLTLSLGPMLSPQVYRIDGFSMGVNYGAEKIRFPSPVPVGSKLRLGVTLLEVTEVDRRHPDQARVLLRGRGRAEAVVRRRGAVPPVHLSAVARVVLATERPARRAGRPARRR